MRPPTETESWRSTTRITARAAEGLAELPREERDAAVEVLQKPFSHLRPHKMSQRKDVDLWRVRVNRDVRITYTYHDGFPLILHVGRHEVSDAFVARCREADDPGLPLEEIELMKAPTKITRVTVTEAPPPAPAALAEDLLRVMSVLIGHVAHQDEQADDELALEGVLTLTATVDALREQVAQLTLEHEDDRLAVEKVQMLLEEIPAERPRDLPSGDMTRLLADQHELRQGLSECESQVSDQGRRLGFARSDCQAQLNELRERVDSLSADVAWLVAKERQLENGWLKRLWRRWRR